MTLICTLRVGVRLIPLNSDGSWGPDTVKEQLLNIESCHLCARHYFKCLTVFEGGMFTFDLQRRKQRLQEGKWVLPPVQLVVMGLRITQFCLPTRLHPSAELSPGTWIQRLCSFPRAVVTKNHKLGGL